GNLLSSLPWFAEALRLGQGDPSRAENHRARLAAVLQQCPKLAQVWFHEGPVSHAEFSADGLRVLTAGADGVARVWDVVTGEAVTPPLVHAGAVSHAAFSPDGRVVLTASKDGTAKLWDAGSGQLLATFTHDGAVKYAAFSPDGRSVVTAS